MVIDILFGIIAIYCLYTGFKRGIVKTLFTVTALIVGFGLAVRLTPAVADLIRSSSGTVSPLVPVVAFLLVFFGTVLLLGLVARVIEKSLKAIKLNVLNQVAGGVLLAAIGTFLLSCVLSFADKAHLITDAAKASSRFYPYLEAVPEKGFAIIREVFPFVRDLWDELMDVFRPR